MGENTLAVISYISCIARRVLFLIYEGGGKFLSKFKAKKKSSLAFDFTLFYLPVEEWGVIPLESCFIASVEGKVI